MQTDQPYNLSHQFRGLIPRQVKEKEWQVGVTELRSESVFFFLEVHTVCVRSDQ